MHIWGGVYRTSSLWLSKSLRTDKYSETGDFLLRWFRRWWIKGCKIEEKASIILRRFFIRNVAFRDRPWRAGKNTWGQILDNGFPSWLDRHLQHFWLCCANIAPWGLPKQNLDDSWGYRAQDVSSLRWHLHDDTLPIDRGRYKTSITGQLFPPAPRYLRAEHLCLFRLRIRWHWFLWGTIEWRYVAEIQSWSTSLRIHACTWWLINGNNKKSTDQGWY